MYQEVKQHRCGKPPWENPFGLRDLHSWWDFPHRTVSVWEDMAETWVTCAMTIFTMAANLQVIHGAFEIHPGRKSTLW